jgi:hypothetical protein
VGIPPASAPKANGTGQVGTSPSHLGRGRTTGGIVPPDKVDQVRAWIKNYHKLKDHLEKISEINRELLRREREHGRKHKRKE